MSLTSPARWRTAISRIRLEGADARRFLHGQSSKAIELAASGSCLPTCLISPTGRMRALALVRPDDSGADLLVIAGDGAAVHQALDRVLFPADRVKLGPVEAATLVRWIGAVASENASQLLSPGVDLGAGATQPAWLQQPGEPLPAWLEALPELSAEAVEQLRLRQGFPAAPGELNDSTNPFELGLADWVSLNKGCYVGQEVTARMKHKTELRKGLAQVIVSGPAATGTAITADGKPAGTLLTRAGDTALAYLRYDRATGPMEAGGVTVTRTA